MKRHEISLGALSRHRALLYGFAAAWILLFHMHFQLPNHPALIPLQWFKASGNAGVEMFLLLSGFGLYGSMSRDGSVLSFYRRRFSRVFLPSFIVVAVYYGLIATSSSSYVLKLTILPYWLGMRMFWYPPFILGMYLLYPLIFLLQKRCPKAVAALWILSYALPVVIRAALPGYANHAERVWTRIPAFLLGCVLAPKVEKDEKVSMLWLLPLAAAYVGLMLTGRWPLTRYALTGLAGFTILLVTRVAPWFTRGGYRRIVYRCLAFLGGISLEAYLVQLRIDSALGSLPVYAGGENGLVKRDLFALILTILLSVALQKFCDLLRRQFARTKVPEE